MKGSFVLLSSLISYAASQIPRGGAHHRIPFNRGEAASGSVEECCEMIKDHPNMVPGDTWGSMNNEDDKKTWKSKNCDDIVGGSSKAKCKAPLVHVFKFNETCCEENGVPEQCMGLCREQPADVDERGYEAVDVQPRSVTNSTHIYPIPQCLQYFNHVQSCQYEQAQCLTKSTTGSTHDIYEANKPCVFPFTYGDRIYNACRDYYNEHWCATTDDYPTDKKWGYCNNNCPTTTYEGGLPLA